jgi:hypothetical protein
LKEWPISKPGRVVRVCDIKRSIGLLIRTTLPSASGS